MKTAKILAALIVLLVIVQLPSFCRASQQPGHIYIALLALEQAPENIQQLLRRNIDHYIAGATGPDIALASFPFLEFTGRHHPGSLPHYEKTGLFISNMLAEAENEQELAFALGWLTHYVTDISVHPLVNQFGGYYTGGRLPVAERKVAKQRHVHLELFEARHVFERYVRTSAGPAADLNLYIVKPDAIPRMLISRAYEKTYVESNYSLDFFRFKFQLPGKLNDGASLMCVATASFVAQARGIDFPHDVAARISKMAVHHTLGDIPTADEYEQMMEPLQITSVTLDVSEKDGEKRETLQVACQINDVHIYRAFADQWDQGLAGNVQKIVDLFNRFVKPSVFFSLDNMNLDTGKAEGVIELADQFYPGFPEIENLMLTCSVIDADGIQRCQIAPGELMEIGTLTEKVWISPAGDCLLEIPLISGGRGPYLVSLSLEFAGADKPPRSFGIKAEWEDMVGKAPPDEPELWSGVFAVESYNGMRINDIYSWQGQLGEPVPLYLTLERNADNLEVIGVQIADRYFHDRGAVFLLQSSDVLSSTFNHYRFVNDMLEALFSVDPPPEPDDQLPLWLEEAVSKIEYPSQSHVLEFTVRTQGSAIGSEYIRFVGVMNEEWTAVEGTFEGGFSDYGKDIAGTWYASQPRHR